MSKCGIIHHLFQGHEVLSLRMRCPTPICNAPIIIELWQSSRDRVWEIHRNLRPKGGWLHCPKPSSAAQSSPSDRGPDGSDYCKYSFLLPNNCRTFSLPQTLAASAQKSSGHCSLAGVDANMDCMELLHGGLRSESCVLDFRCLLSLQP